MFTVSIEAIKKAQKIIAPHIKKTPFLESNHLSRMTGKSIFLKCENLQRTGSFKIRGSSFCILENLERAKKNGVIAASAGNHAQGVAAISHSLGIRATIIMPKNTPALKVQNTQSWNAEVILHGEVYDESFDYAVKLANTKGSFLVHPFKDPLVAAGQGTLGLELIDEAEFKNIEAVVVAVGGGGLLTGIATVLRTHFPALKIYGVSSKNAPATWKSFHTQTECEVQVTQTLAEGVAARKGDFDITENLKTLINDYFIVSEESIAEAISLLAEHGKLIVEGAGALPLAAVLEGQVKETRIALVLSGGNIDPTTLACVLHRGLSLQRRFVRLVVSIPDKPGGLNSLTSILAESGANIQQVFHSRNIFNLAPFEAEVEVDIETCGQTHTDDILTCLKTKGFHVVRVT